MEAGLNALERLRPAGKYQQLAFPFISGLVTYRLVQTGKQVFRGLIRLISL